MKNLERNIYLIFEKHGGWLFPLIIAFFAIVVTESVVPKAAHGQYIPLKGNPETGDVYFIGNSMFGTGLDMDKVRSSLPNEHSVLGYYDGCYSSMWYSAFRNSLVPSGVRPKVIVWGFRPTYAVLPAFRQNRETELDLLYDTDDYTFRSVLRGAKDEVFGASTKPEETLADFSGFRKLLDRYFPVVLHRNDAKTKLLNGLAFWISSLYSKSNQSAEKFSKPNSGLKISDLIVAFSTSGRIQRADALVVDNGEHFITGSRVPFDQSFIPLTAKILKTAEIPQIVVIFKPVVALEGNMHKLVELYYKDAIEYFESNNINYVDFVSDPLLSREMYAKGDHYTQEGMSYVTNKILAHLKTKGLLE